MERKLGETVLESGKRVNDCVYEVPFVMSLTQFLSDSFILEEVMTSLIRHVRTCCVLNLC